MRHRHSPAGDQREQSVMCQVCMRLTWNVCGCCDKHCCHKDYDNEYIPVRGPGSIASAKRILRELKGE